MNTQVPAPRPSAADRPGVGADRRAGGDFPVAAAGGLRRRARPAVALGLLAGSVWAWWWAAPGGRGVPDDGGHAAGRGHRPRRLVPVLRPTRPSSPGLAGLLILRAVVTSPPAPLPPRLNRIELVLLAMATANSVLPLLVMVLRGQQSRPTTSATRSCSGSTSFLRPGAGHGQDRPADRHLPMGRDVLRVRGRRHRRPAGPRPVRRAHALVEYYAPFGYTGALAAPRRRLHARAPGGHGRPDDPEPRGAAGLWWKDRRHGALLLGFACVFVAGSFGRRPVLQRARAARRGAVHDAGPRDG